MKTTLFIILLFLSNLSAQQYHTFSELKGMEDQLGETNLFYRLYYYWSGNGTYGPSESHSIYRFEPNSNIDTLFLYDGGWSGQDYTSIDDYDFWENDYSRYIYAGTYISTEGFPFVGRYDQQQPIFSPQMWGGSKNIELSRQDTNIIFVAIDYGNSINFKTTDWGSTWDTLANGYEILSVSPFNDKVIFFSQWLTLLKSIDGGVSFYTVDTSRIYLNNFIYDNDETHIYAIDNRYGYHLVVSDNVGEPFSWTERYSSSDPIYVSIDHSQSGSIYLADRKYIYLSTDFGVTFNEYKTLDKRIVGIYKKPNSDKLYAATKYDLYEIAPDTTITLKHLPLDPDIFSWFPLKVGNKWVYNSRFTSESEINEHTFVTKVTRQFRYNDKTYFDINGEYGLCYRVDSTSGKIYRSYFDGDTLDYEELYIDLTSEIGDTIYVDQFGESYPILFANEEGFNEWNLNSRKRDYSGLSTPLYNLSLVKNIGLYYQVEWELIGNEDQLKGAIINGKVYGDTTLVGVTDPDNLSREFSLSQNYPNPFNPATSIEYRVGSSEYVTLKVYDVIGREVATLVNEEKLPGNYEVKFNPVSGIWNLASGIYFYRLQAGSYTSTKKMCLMR